MAKNHISYQAIWIVRIIVAAVFIFSGVVKANDPIGFGYKLEEYFTVFGLPFLNDYKVAFAIFICSLEIILGSLLIFGFWRKKVVWGLLLLTIFFTFLTFYSAYFEVVTSCGCFGDAIPLTPWQSFIKDCILLLLISFLVYHQRKITPLISDSYTRSILTACIIVISVGLGVYTYNFLPIVDFLPYKVGNHLPSLMTVPEGESLDEYETIYTLENERSGEVKKMTDKEYLSEEIWKDEEWKIIGDPETRLVKEGYQVPISDLIINDHEGINRTDDIVANPDNILLIVAYDINKANQPALLKMNKLAKDLARDYRLHTVLLTASTLADVESAIGDSTLYAEALFADAVPLKTMVRSNPGLVLLRDGVVIKKWHFHLMPDAEQLSSKYLSPE
ncbi:BT_3928 family protein [Albibacterium profundi]|uniref:BT_3928 family protein n=1 Tax=Albibacterium profundi TaxID=3134906 RepID=A0ABV5CCM1_9SPHI